MNVKKIINNDSLYQYNYFLSLTVYYQVSSKQPHTQRVLESNQLALVLLYQLQNDQISPEIFCIRNTFSTFGS